MKSNFIRRSIFAVLSILKDSVFSDEISRRRGFLQQLSVHLKLFAFCACLILVLFISNPLFLTFFYLFCLLLAASSKIEILFFLKRTLIFIPLFTLFIALPMMFKNFSAGFEFILRVTVLVSLAVLLSITTRHFELLKALRFFKVPQIFVITTGMAYRYIYLFLEIISQTYLAIKSRVGEFIKAKKGQKIVAWNIASLWSRSLNLSEEVYRAMLSRGFSGEFHTWEN